MSQSLRLTLIWLLGSIVTLVMTLQMAAASFAFGRYLPVGHDAFYHGRRVLAAVASGHLYQFDPGMHAPEGDWVTWPWLYDSVLAWLTRGIQFATGGNPETVLMHLPPLLGLLGVVLVIATGVTIGLPELAILIVTLCYALQSFTQFQFGVGSLDHHGAEQLVTLCVLLLGMRWLQKPGSRARSIAVGAVLGAAIGVHAGMVILQVPVVIACGLLWLRGDCPPLKSVASLVAAMVATTLVVLLPASTFWQGRFDLYYLSGLHLYIAFASGLVMLVMARWPFSVPRLAMLLVLVALLAIPLVAALSFSGSFLSGELATIRDIDEIKSPFSDLGGPLGMRRLDQVYSLLIWLAPPMVVTAMVLAFRDRERGLVLFWVTCALTLTLLILQRRLGSYGVAFLYLPVLLLAVRATKRWPGHGSAILGVVAIAVAVAYVPTVRYQLFARRVPSMDEHFSSVRFVLPALAEACLKDPGVVLADPGDGHLVRYFTDCQVIGNNFRLTPLDVRKVADTLALIGMPLEQMRSRAPYVKYVLARLAEPMESADPVLFTELLGRGGQAAPDVQVIAEVESAVQGEGSRKVLGVYRIGEGIHPGG